MPFKSLDFQRRGFNYRETLSMTVCGSSARNSSEKSKSGQSVGLMGGAEPLQEPVDFKVANLLNRFAEVVVLQKLA